VSGKQLRYGWKIINWQLLITILTAAALFIIFDLTAAFSALVGGLVSVAANAIFAIRLFDDNSSWQAEQLTASLYRGLIGKYFLTIALFVLAVVVIEPLNIPALFAVYLWVQVSPALIAGIAKA
jgi:ATP synthase protein I